MLNGGQAAGRAVALIPISQIGEFPTYRIHFSVVASWQVSGRRPAMLGTTWSLSMLAMAISVAASPLVFGQDAKRNATDLATAAPSVVANRSADIPRRVLTLDQDDWGRPVALEGYSHLRRRLMEGLEGRAIVSGESLDLARFNQPGYLDELRVWLGRKYAKFKPEVIVAFGEECLTFASRLRAELWPETPIVFAAIPPERFRELRLPPNCTGVIHNDFHLSETLAIARQLFPGSHRVAFVAGDVRREPFNQAPYKEFLSLSQEWERIDLTGLPMAELRQKIASLPDQTIIYYSAVFVDGDGKIWGGPQALREVESHAARPIFCNLDTFVGQGALGGKTLSMERFASDVALLTLRTMAEGSASRIPLEYRDASRPVFDDRLLHKFGVSRQQLPAAAELRFRVPSLWEDYRVELRLAAVVFAVQSLTLSWLVVSLWRRQYAERSLRRTNQYLEMAAESAEVNVWEWDIERNWVSTSDRLRRLFPVADGQRLGIEQFTERTHPEDAALWHEALIAPPPNCSGFDLSCRFVLANGEVRWLDFRGLFELRDGSDERLRARGVVTDVTRRTQAEMELATRRENAAQFTRASTLGEMAASIAHELGQPLTAIRNFAEAATMLLADPAPQIEKARKAVTHIQHDGQRAADILVKIRSLFQRRTLETEVISAKEFFQGVGQLMRPVAEQHQTRLSLQLSPTIATIVADRVCLQQAIVNLLVNAIDASRDLPLAHRVVALEAHEDGSGGAVIEVHDNGPGIAAENLAKVFTPFYSTKPQGLGLGLPLVRSIAEAHGGRIRAVSNPPEGTTFILELPAPTP